MPSLPPPFATDTCPRCGAQLSVMTELGDQVARVTLYCHGCALLLQMPPPPPS